MLRTCGGQLVDTNPPIGRRRAPLRFDQLLLEKTLESRIQRTFFDLKQIVGRAFDVLRQRIAVQGLAFQGPENHHLQGTRKEVSLYRPAHAGQSALLKNIVLL
jgi:hypothetical protein